jgi:CelD/BcsL family acetyltransferase involved in cellulose biosynthesis
MNFALVKTENATPEHAQPLLGLPALSGSGWSVEIAGTLEAAEPAWRALLDRNCFATAYQDFDLCALWLRHVGAPEGFEPFVVIGRDAMGEPTFVWPLVRRKAGPCMVASYFLGRHANAGTAIWRRDVAAGVTVADLHAILRHLAQAGIDALALSNQPMQMQGLPNPLLLLPHQDAPDKSYSVTLNGTGEEIIARRFHGETRRKLRRKERHLTRLPGYRYVRATTPEQVDRCVSDFLKQKAARLAARGIGNAFDEAGMDDFLRAACRHGLAEGAPLIEIHALASDDEILALFAGIHDRHSFATMFNSYTLGEHARMSPGLTLLLKLVEDSAQRGFDSLSLGIGAAEYKSALCDVAEQPFDSVIGLSPRGHAFALATRSMRMVKGTIKNNPRLWGLFNAARAKLFAPKASSKA